MFAWFKFIQEARGESNASRNFAFTPPPTELLPSFFGPESAHIPSTPDAFTSPDMPLFDADALAQENSLSLAEQGEIREQDKGSAVAPQGAGVRRDSKGRLKRLQRRTSAKPRIASTRQGAQNGDFSTIFFGDCRRSQSNFENYEKKVLMMKLSKSSSNIFLRKTSKSRLPSVTSKNRKKQPWLR